MRALHPIMVFCSATLVLISTGLGQPALPDPEPAMMDPTPAATPSLFVPFDPGASRPLLPAATPQAVPQLPQATQTPGIPTAPAVPVLPPTATPAATRTPATRGTPVPLFVPSDFGPAATPAPTPDAEPPPPVDEDFIPGDTGPDLSAPPSLLDLEPSTPQPVLPAAVATPTPAPKPRPRPAASTQNVAPSASQVNSWVVQANRTQDPALATRIGWAFFNREDFGSAGIWFSQALDWDPKLGEAAYGLALTKFRERDLASAEAIVNFRGGSYPKMKALEGDIYVQRSLDYYGMKRYGQSLEYMQKAAACRPLNRDEETILAWNYYQTRNYAEAAEIFERLYNRSRDEQTAQGLYASLSKLQDYEQLDRLATAGGPLKTVYATYEARQYYEAGLYRASADVGGDKVYPELMNLNGPSLALGLGYATKSGTEGEGQLATGVLPIFFGQFSPGEKTIISAWIKRITLDSGTLNNGAQVGTFPEEFQPYAQDPITEYDDLWEFGVGFA